MRRLALATPFLVIAIAACGGSGGTGVPSTAAPATQPEASVPAGSETPAACVKASPDASPAVTVQIKDFAYSPEPIKANVGDVIGWTNGDAAQHTASLEDGSCSTDGIDQGATGALVFNVAGTYTYQCNVHPDQMNGYTIEVE